MKTELLRLVAACALLGSTVAANASPYVVTMDQVGSNVVATGTGQIDLTGLSVLAVDASETAGIAPNADLIVLGQGQTDFYDAFAGSPPGPPNFGTGTFKAADSSSGSLTGGGFGASFVEILVPTGYISDALLSDSTATFNNATFATLGVTPGTYVWTWGTGADQSFTLEIGATPLPAALPLFATGLGAIGLLGWRRKRKAQAVTS